MPPLSINDFQNVFATSGTDGLNGCVSIEGEKLVVSQTARSYQSQEPTEEMKVRNREVRTALVEALARDAKCGSAYRDMLTRELLGEAGAQELDTTQLKSILDRHITLKTLARAGAQAEGTAATFVQQAATQAVSVKTLQMGKQEAKQFFKNLQTDGGLSSKETAAFKDALNVAENNLRCAYALKGAQAGTVQGQEALKAAADALENLEIIARQVNNRLVRRGADVPPKLEELLDFAAARHSELRVIGGEIEGIAAFGRDVGRAPTVQQMMAALAGKMHTAAEVAEQIEGKLNALNNRLNTYAENLGEKTTEQEIGNIRHDLASLGAFTQEAQASGLLEMTNGVSLHLETSFVKGLAGHLQRLDQALTQTVQLSFEQGMLKILDDAFGKCDKSDCNAAVKWVKDQFTDRIRKQQAIDTQFLQHVILKSEQLLTIKYGSIREANLFDAYPRCLHRNPLTLLTERIVKLQNRQIEAGKGVLAATNGDVKALLAGNLAMETLLGARIYGFEGELIDARLDDTSLVASKPLGSGAFNTVERVAHKVKNEQGETEIQIHVFKPETAALIGLGSLRGGGDTAYHGGNAVAQINRASHQAAKMLGAQHVMPKITVGMHKGQFGFFMEEAHGQTPANYHDGKYPDGSWMLPEDRFPNVHKMNPAQKILLTGSLMKGTNELMWTDWLTGQIDRHEDNYLVSVDKNGKATVKGVDNDASFSAERVGLRKFRLDKDRLDDLLALAGVDTPEKFNALFPNNPLKPVGPKGMPMEIDLGDNKALQVLGASVFGVHSFARPTVIGREMYTKLMALKDLGPEELHEQVRNMMGKGWFTTSQTKATDARLREMIAYVQTFTEDQIIDEAEWNDEAKQRDILANMKAHDATLDKRDNGLPPNPNHILRNSVRENANRLRATQDYYLRDFSSLMN